MIVLVCGGREFDDRDFLFSVLDRVHAKYGDDLVIITGAQRKRKPDDSYCGADYLAQEWAIDREVEYMGFPARWKKLGSPAAGGERNRRMRDKAKPDAAVAFEGGRGTELMCNLMLEIGIKPWRPKP
ncbi:DUF2493 domain-containing protein [Rhizobium azibense]|uniref:Uncharacterized protein DUF2493 n=1 Tax=Rhizobium azibense TaxID=1136135 RepID=A0A4R3RI69_9HYPH|nr:DUF2493 domain-containing protein [Rhizobium azibense]TCU34137.1 uncharacterized protein DUF2493 [Rhizobium azibense]